MDLKTAGEAVGLIGTLKEVKDKFTGKDKEEVGKLQEQLLETKQKLAESEQRLAASELELSELHAQAINMTTDHLAMLTISAVGIVAIIAILLIASQRGMMQG